MKRLAVLGASGHGKVVADIAECCGWDEIVFFDDAWPSMDSNGKWPIKGNSQLLVDQSHYFSGVAVAIGNNAVRAEKIRWLTDLSISVVSLVHPNAIVSRYVDLGIGSVVMPGVVINAASSIGKGVILNTGCIVDHDCVIDDFAHISPGARLAGGVRVGFRSWVGIGASVIQLVSIGQDVMVGAGAVVVDNLPDAVTVTGVPAKSS